MKRDGSRQNPTPAQERALDALLAGASVTDAAQAANVTRQTVSQWIHHDVAFVAELATRRAATWDSLRRKLEDSAAQALDVLKQLLKSEDPKVSLAAATKIIDVLGLTERVREPSATTPESETYRRARAAEAELLDRARQQEIERLDRVIAGLPPA